MKYLDERVRWERAVDCNDFVVAKQVLADHPEMLTDPELVVYLLYYAACQLKVGALTMLVDLGVDVNLPLSEHRPDRALWYAAIRGGRNPEPGLNTVRWLIARGARVNFGFGDEPPYCYPLMQAMKNNDLEMVELMVSTGEPLNLLGKFNQTPLTWALDCGRDEIAAYLRSKGAKESHEVPGWVPPPPPDPVPDHVAGAVGPVEARGWVPVVPDGDPPVAIRAATRDDGVVCVFTDGMSEQALPPGPGGDAYQHAELALYLSGWPADPGRWLEPEYRWPLDWLRRLARHPFESGAGFGGPVAVVANGEPPAPLGPGTAMTCWLLLADKAPLGRFDTGDGREVVFYELVPVHTAERDFERAHGVAALLERFAAAGVPEHLDPGRRSVV